MKVRATNVYVKENIRDSQLDRIPKEGEEFEVTQERYKILSGNNKYKKVFVELVEEIETAIKDEPKKEKAVRRRKVNNDL